MQDRDYYGMVTGWRARASGTMPTEVGPSHPPEGMVGKATLWLRRRILSVALSVASFITLISLVMPAWADFVFDLAMVGLIALVGKLARRR